MIKLRFNIQQLYSFYQFLVDCVKNLELSKKLSSDFYSKRQLTAEVSELNTCLLKVQNKLFQFERFRKVQKTYTIGISPMQGLVITSQFESSDELPPYLWAILSEQTETINKSLA